MALTASTGSLTTNGQATSPSINISGDFSVSLSGTWTGTVAVQRSFDNGATWLTVKSYTANAEERGFEPEQGVPPLYRMACTAVMTGTAVLRLSY
jgi:hypothetical protein